MTYSRPRVRFTGCAVVSSLLLLTACSSADGENEAGGTSPSSTQSSSPTTAVPSENKATARAQAVLAAVHTGSLLEAGAERVTDGIHTEPTLSKGKTYKLTLVCVGSGSAQLSFAPEGAGEKAAVPCDQSVVQQRITHDGPVRIDVDAVKGASGVIAWQIDVV